MSILQRSGGTMSKNKTQSPTKKAKNREFYTPYADIAKERST